MPTILRRDGFRFVEPILLTTDVSGILGRPVKPDDDSLVLLFRQRDSELAVVHAGWQALNEFRHRVLAICPYQFGERREQARLCETVAVDPVMARFRPGLVEIAERGLFLLVVRQRLAAGEMK